MFCASGQPPSSSALPATVREYRSLRSLRSRTAGSFGCVLAVQMVPTLRGGVHSQLVTAAVR